MQNGPQERNGNRQVCKKMSHLLDTFFNGIIIFKRKNLKTKIVERKLKSKDKLYFKKDKKERKDKANILDRQNTRTYLHQLF